MTLLIWAGIALCVAQSAMFSGLNLAFFSLGRMRLEAAAQEGDKAAVRVLKLREDPNGLLVTILVGNVAVNVLLTLLSDSVLTGVAAFLFSTVVITAFGEILPQAYFSRNALAVSSALAPLFQLYRVALYPIAKPMALALDAWLGKEGPAFFRERELRHVIGQHIEAREAEIDRFEGTGALNFLAIDDLSVVEEGEPLNPASIVELPFDAEHRPRFPDYQPNPRDPFLRRIEASSEKWVVLVDADGEPQLVMDADGFLRDALFIEEALDPGAYCHRPIVVRDATERMGAVLSRWERHADSEERDVIDKDLILFWSDDKRVITGADVLGRLLRGISRRPRAS